MDNKKRNIIIIVGVIIILSVLYNIGTENNSNKPSENSENIQNKTQSEEDKLKSELFGDKEDKTNYYFENEKTIRKFVLAYNEKSLNKIAEVNWKNNHQISNISINNMSAKLNSGSSLGFLVEFEFGNGKEMIESYKSVIKDMVSVFDSNVSEETFNQAFENANTNQYKETNITENIIIKMHYSKDQVGYASGDRYYIDLNCTNYNK